VISRNVTSREQQQDLQRILYPPGVQERLMARMRDLCGQAAEFVEGHAPAPAREGQGGGDRDTVWRKILSDLSGLVEEVETYKARSDAMKAARAETSCSAGAPGSGG
jgi:hypothetical protein